jgi:hypothetical protein
MRRRKVSRTPMQEKEQGVALTWLALPLSNHASAASRARPLGHHVSRQRQKSVKSMLSRSFIMEGRGTEGSLQRALRSYWCPTTSGSFRDKDWAKFASAHSHNAYIYGHISKKLHAHYWKLRLGRVEVDHQGPARGHTVVRDGSPGEPHIVCQRTHILPNNILCDTPPTGVSSLPFFFFGKACNSFRRH